MQNVPNGPTDEAVSPRAAADPMLVLVRAYEAELTRYNASDCPDDETEEAHLNWLADRLTHDTPPIYTHEGANAALRLVAADAAQNMSSFQAPVLEEIARFIRAYG